MTVNKLNSIIKESKNILIVSHINPDGDTLGAMCGLYSLILKNYKKKPSMVITSPLPTLYGFIPNIDKANIIDDMDLSREFDLVINVDIAAIDRCSNAKILFDRAKFTVNIDHHKTNNGYADLNIIDPKASAASEIIIDIANSLSWKFDKDSASSLYTGIVTDTGSFKFSNTTQKTLELAGQMISHGILPSDISEKCYDSNPKNMVLFQSYCVNKAKFYDNDTVACTTVYKKDLEKFSAEEDFTEGLAEKLRSIKSVEISFIVKELATNISKVSMRSRKVDVSQICAVFGGGGHKLAAGTIVKNNVSTTVKLILDEIKNAKKNSKI